MSESSSPSTAPTDPLVGTELGGYSIEALLGEGAVGKVYRARQVALDRRVALKVLRPAMAVREDAVERFRREARAAATIKHPHLIEVFDFGETDGTYYYAMELVEGRSLGHYLKRGEKFSERECIEVGRQALSALNAAHKAGIVHRDVEPGNLMLNRKGQIKLGDLGLAYSIERGGDAGLTLPGISLGTPHYMSPEQAQGLGEIDYRADFYGLGATLFHLAAGRPPFEGRNDFEVITAHLNAPVPSVREVNPSVSQAFSDLIGRLLAKKPEDRPQSHTEIYSELDRCREPVPETERTETRIAFSAAAKIEKQRITDSWVVLAAAAAVLVSVGVGIYALWIAPEGPAAKRALPEPDREVTAPARTAEEAKPAAEVRPAAPAVPPPAAAKVPEKPAAPVVPTAVTPPAEKPPAKPAPPEAPLEPPVPEPAMPPPKVTPSVFGRTEEWSIDGILVPLREAAASAKRQTAERVARYVKDLEDIEKKVSARADLDGALAVKAEREAWGAGAAPDRGGANDPSAPAELRNLRHFLNRDLQVMNSRNEVRFETERVKALAALRALEARFTRGGRLDAAIAVRSATEQLEKRQVPQAVQGAEGKPPAEVAVAAQPADVGSRSGNLGDPKEATKDRPFVNSLGMKFVPVKGTRVLFSVWETRVCDFGEFVKAAVYTGVDYPPFKQEPDHPVVMVRWNDAKAFCKWLSEKEGVEYRLPTGQEWSAAAGKGKYPWGDEYPPPKDVENLAGEEAKIGPGDPSDVIENWRDNHPRTAPVGSYRKNRFGLYDLGGNVWEWCEDVYTGGAQDFAGDEAPRLGRGGHWATGTSAASVLSARQDGKIPTQCDATSGFRCVIVLPQEP